MVQKIRDISKNSINFNQFGQFFFVVRLKDLRSKKVASQYIIDGMIFSLYEEKKDHFVFWSEYTPILLVHK